MKPKVYCHSKSTPLNPILRQFKFSKSTLILFSDLPLQFPTEVLNAFHAFPKFHI